MKNLTKMIVTLVAVLMLAVALSNIESMLSGTARYWNTSGLPDDKSASSDTPKSGQISREFFGFDFWRRDVRFWRGPDSDE